MGKIIISLMAIAVFVFIGMSMSQNFLDSFDSMASEFVELNSRNENIARTGIEPVSTNLLPGREILEITLRNTGELKQADFERWDFTVQYYDYLNNYQTFWLDYVAGTPGDNQWTVKGIYTDASSETAEVLNPDILDTDEEIVLQAKLSPAVHIAANNLAIVSTADGVKTWNYFRYILLYLHNNPTPPTGDTNAQADLPLNYVIPSATVLYDYDADLGGHAGPGRLIELSGGSADESNLDDYQNWQMLFSTVMYDTLEFDTANGRNPDIIHIAGDIHAIAYCGTNNDGYIKTVEISSAGEIADTVIDTLEYDTTQGEHPDIIRVSGDVYAIAHAGGGDDGFVTTVKISAAGEITDTVVDTMEYNGSNGREPDIINISGDIFAIAYRGGGDDGYLTTVQISPTGEITDTVVETLEYDASNGENPSLVHVSGDIFAIAYQGPGDNGYLVTVEISSAGDITDTMVDTLVFDTVDGWEPDIIHVSDDIYAIAYRGVLADGFLSTVQISAAGDITNTVVDTLEFDTADGFEPDIIHVSGDIYAIAYRGGGDDGYVTTVEISTTGDITDTVVDTLEFDTTYGEGADPIHFRGNIYAIAYTDVDDDGQLKTVKILPDGTFGTAIEIDGNVYFSFWSGTEGFVQSRRGVVIAYLRDYDGSGYTEIASETLDLADWQNGSDTWGEKIITFPSVSHTLVAGHYLELKLLVLDTSEENIQFAYDTTTYNSYLELP